jgi:hypothetical protein
MFALVVRCCRLCCVLLLSVLHLACFSFLHLYEAPLCLQPLTNVLKNDQSPTTPLRT